MRFRNQGHRPPGPRGHWLAGNLAAYERDRLGFLLALREEHGAIVRFGARTTILNDPSIATGLLRDGTEAFAPRENFLQQPLSAQKGRQVVDLRNDLNPVLRRAAIRPIEDIVSRHLAAQLKTWLPDQGDSWVDPMPHLEQVISTAVAEFYFGPADAPTICELVCDLLDELSTVIGNPYALPQTWKTAVRKRIETKRLALRIRIDSLLEERHNHAQPDHARPDPAPPVDAPPDLARDIVARVGGRHTDPAVADMVVASLLAAQRVPAAGASWLLMLLADHPHLQDQLQANAISSANGDCRDASENSERRRGLSALQVEHVVMESLRLYPPTWLITRTSTQPVAVGGYHFGANHHFMVSPYVLHRDPHHFDDPDTFRPERWTGSWTDSRRPSAFMPFGTGARVCPGRHLATQILATIARQLTAAFTLTRAPGPITADPRTTLLPRGLRIRLEPRNQPSRRSRHVGVAGGVERRAGEPQPLASPEPAFF